MYVMDMRENAMEWYRSLVGEGATVNAVAERAGVVQTTLNRQVKAGALSHETVVALARAYRADVLDGLVASGLITHEDIKAHAVQTALGAASDVDLASEIMKRAERGSPTLSGPLAD